jgi:purine-binding chemotaxis protein CheW
MSALLTARVERWRVAVPLEEVARVLPSLETTPLPEGPPALVGFANIARRPVPVVSLRAAFGAPPLEDDLDARIVLCPAGDRGHVGLLVDDATLLAEAEAARPLQGDEGPAPADLFRAVAVVGGEVHLVLDPAAALRRLGELSPPPGAP